MTDISKLSKSTRNNGFILSDIFSRFNSLMKKQDYDSINSNTKFEDILVLLTKHYPHLNEDVRDLMDLEALLSQNLRKESQEISTFNDNDLPVIYYQDKAKIEELFYFLGHFVSNKNPKKAMAFPELKCLKFCKTFLDLKNLILRNTGIDKYFLNLDIKSELGDNNLGLLYFQVLKNFFDYQHNIFKESEYFTEILRNEAALFVCDLLDSGNGELIPELFDTKNLNDLKKIMGDGLERDILRNRLLESYRMSFDYFIDCSMPYSYLKLKEYEMKKLLFIIEESINTGKVVKGTRKHYESRIN